MADATIYDDKSALTGKVVSPAHLAHLVLRTTQFQPMVAFYTAFLGARVAHANPMICFLAYDEEHHRVAIVNLAGRIGPRDPGASGLDHVAFTFASLADLALAYRQRRARGILPVHCVNHGVTTSLYYQDPDGNRIETQVDNFDTVAEAAAYMESPAFGENPLGVDFDPEDLVRRLQAGEDEAAIKKRPDIGPRSIEDYMKKVPPPPLVKDSYDPTFV